MNGDIEIRRAKNGYWVVPPRRDHGSMLGPEDIVVFETIIALQVFLKQHFEPEVKLVSGYAFTAEQLRPDWAKELTCKGSYAFGSACGHCERCKQDPLRPLPAGLSTTVAQ